MSRANALLLRQNLYVYANQHPTDYEVFQPDWWKELLTLSDLWESLKPLRGSFLKHKMLKTQQNTGENSTELRFLSLRNSLLSAILWRTLPALVSPKLSAPTGQRRQFTGLCLGFLSQTRILENLLKAVSILS